MPKYYRPTTRADALAALAEGGAAARPLVGGTDLLVGLRHHTVEPELLVDLKGVTDLPEPDRRRPTTACTIGATYTLAELVAAPGRAAVVPGAGRGRAHRRLGRDPQPGQPDRQLVQRVAGGRHRSPAARARTRRSRSRRPRATGPRSLDDFFLGPRRTLCGPGELVTRIDLPRPAAGSRLGVPPADPAPRRRPRHGQRRRRRRRRRPDRARAGRGRPAAAARRDRRPGRPRRRRRARRAPSTSCWRSPPRSPTSGAAATTGSRRSASSPSARSSPLSDRRNPRGDGVMTTTDHLRRRRPAARSRCTVNGSAADRRRPGAPHPARRRCATRSGCPAPRAAAPRASAVPAPCCSTARRSTPAWCSASRPRGTRSRTIEGLSADGLTDLQEEFLNAGAVQCGFCIPGQVVARRVPAAHQPRPRRGRDPRGPLGQPVPLRRLPAHRPRGAGHRRPAGSGAMTTAPERAIEQRDELGEPSDLYPGGQVGRPVLRYGGGDRAIGRAAVPRRPPVPRRRCRSPS